MWVSFPLPPRFDPHAAYQGIPGIGTGFKLLRNKRNQRGKPNQGAAGRFL